MVDRQTCVDKMLLLLREHPEIEIKLSRPDRDTFFEINLFNKDTKANICLGVRINFENMGTNSYDNFVTTLFSHMTELHGY